VSWHQAASYCNALSREAGLGACYRCEGTDAEPICELDESYALKGKAYTCPGYRLPTEAEWERAASPPEDASAEDLCDDAQSFDQAAWFEDNAGDQPHPVGEKTANGWGLFDTSGNVAEWTNDWYSDLKGVDAIDPSGASFSHSKVVRGGSFQSRVDGLHWWSRSQAATEAQISFIGFRCVRSLGTP
jgi:formylglycine-generating enzyme required for sulfatase activity